MLNINGYETYSLKFGMCSWTDDASVNMGKCYTPEGAGHDYQTVSGAEPGEWTSTE
jgi:hypothetical protein